jgi:hypothetical protein
MDFSLFNKYSQEFIDDHIFNMTTLGFNVIPDFFSADQCEFLRNKLEKTIDDYVPLINLKEVF